MKIPHRSGAVLAVVLALAAGCGKKGDQPASDVTVSAEAALDANAYVEENDNGSVAWNVSPEGGVKAVVSGPDKKPISDNVSGTLTWHANGEPKTVPLAFDAKTGLLTASGPKLEADLTPIDYALSVAGKPWTGTLHVPVGGTAELAADAKASADIALPEGKLGPHGGRIQVVGKDRLELVADQVTGDVRVYLLDPELHAIAIGDRKITLGVVADAPELVVLTPAEGGAYCAGKWGLKVDPLKVTIAVRTGATAAVALVGYRPGVAVVVGARAPRVKVRVKADWDAHVDANAALPDVDVDAKVKGSERALANAKARVEGDARAAAHAGAEAKAGIELHGPSVKISAPKIDIHPKASVHASADAKVKVH